MKTLFRLFIITSLFIALTACSDDLLSVSKEGEIAIDLQGAGSDGIMQDIDVSGMSATDLSGKSDIDEPDEGLAVGGIEGLMWTYHLYLSFTDGEGNDLVKQLVDEKWNYLEDSKWNSVVNPEKCHLDVIYSNPPAWFDNSIYNARADSGFTPDVNKRYFTFLQNGYDLSDSPWYLSYQDMTSTNLWGEEVQDMILKIMSPTLFGDGKIHDVATYWEEGEERGGAQLWAKCSKVVFEGQEFLPVKNVRTEHHEQGQYIWDAIFVDYFVDIVLDK